MAYSPYIISYLNPSWIHIGMNRKPGVAEFFAFKKSGQKQLENDAAGFNFIKEIKPKYDDCEFTIVLCSDTDVFDFAPKPPIKWDEVKKEFIPL